MTPLILTEKQFRVLRWLVENKPTTEYEIGRKAGVNSFVAHKAPRILLKKGILRFRYGGKARSGRRIKIFYPTFKGFLAYFGSHLPEDSNFQTVQKYYEEKRENLRRAILNAQKLYPEEKIFTEWSTIIEWRGEIMSYYQLCYAAAYTIKYPHPTAEYYEESLGEDHTGLLEVILNEKDPTRMEMLRVQLDSIIEKEDLVWRLAFEESFTLYYTNLIFSNELLNKHIGGKVKPIPNENLYNFFQEIIDGKIREAEDRIQKLNLMKKAFKELFGEEKKDAL